MSSLDLRFTYDQEDFNMAHDVQKYGLGLKVSIEDIGNEYMTIYYYFKAKENLDAYFPVEIDSFIEAQKPTNPDYNMELVIPQYNVLQGQYAFGVFQGRCKVSVFARNVPMSEGDYGKAENDETSLVPQTNSFLTAGSMGVIEEDITSGTTKIVSFIALGRGVRVST